MTVHFFCYLPFGLGILESLVLLQLVQHVTLKVLLVASRLLTFALSSLLPRQALSWARRPNVVCWQESGLCGSITGDDLIRMGSHFSCICWCTSSCCSPGLHSVQMCSTHPNIKSAFSSTTSALYVALMIVVVVMLSSVINTTMPTHHFDQS